MVTSWSRGRNDNASECEIELDKEGGNNQRLVVVFQLKWCDIDNTSTLRVEDFHEWSRNGYIYYQIKPGMSYSVPQLFCCAEPILNHESTQTPKCNNWKPNKPQQTTMDMWCSSCLGELCFLPLCPLSNTFLQVPELTHQLGLWALLLWEWHFF